MPSTQSYFGRRGNVKAMGKFIGSLILIICLQLLRHYFHLFCEAMKKVEEKIQNEENAKNSELLKDDNKKHHIIK